MQAINPVAVNSSASPCTAPAGGQGGELLAEPVEPIAADVRPHQDGKDNARLKLLARPHGCAL